MQVLCTECAGSRMAGQPGHRSERHSRTLQGKTQVMKLKYTQPLESFVLAAKAHLGMRLLRIPVLNCTLCHMDPTDAIRIHAADFVVRSVISCLLSGLSYLWGMPAFESGHSALGGVETTWFFIL